MSRGGRLSPSFPIAKMPIVSGFAPAGSIGVYYIGRKDIPANMTYVEKRHFYGVLRSFVSLNPLIQAILEIFPCIRNKN